MRFEFIEYSFDPPAARVEGGQLPGRSFGRRHDVGDQAVDWLGAWNSLELIIDHAQGYAVRLVAPIGLSGIGGASMGAVCKPLQALQAHVLAHPPDQFGPGGGGLAPQFRTVKVAVRQTQHLGRQTGSNILGERHFTHIAAIRLGAEENVGSIFQEGDKSQLWICAGSAAGRGSPKRFGNLGGIGDIQRAAVQTHDSPGAISCAARALHPDRGCNLMQKQA